MIKKFLSMVAIAGMVFTTSCSSDEFEPAQNGGEAVVSFTTELPSSLQSRAFGDGTTATNLSYFVYDAEWNYLEDLSAENGKTMDEYLKATVTLSLINGEEYNIVFWADAVDAPYTFDADSAKVAMNYANPAANAENRDAFYKVVKLTVNGNESRPVELTRPFAQINIGTNDWAEVVKTTEAITHTGITVKTYPTLNFKNGKAEGNATDVTFTPDEMPEGETFPVGAVDEYKYLSMNYILATTEKQVVDVTISYNDAIQDRTFTSVPVQRNYRTNIYGKLITSDEQFDVEIKPGFDGAYDNGGLHLWVSNLDEFNAAFANAEVAKVTLTEDIQVADDACYLLKNRTFAIDLGGKTLSANSTQTGKNYNLFDVNTNSVLTVENGSMEYQHTGADMEWNSSTNIFNVTAGGVLNLKGVTAKNLGGSSMAFVAHLNNWGEVTLNVEESILESSYIAVRVFNSGPHMNNVDIKNSTLQGKKIALWVHNYTLADFGGDATKTAKQQALVKDMKIFNQGNSFLPNTTSVICYGFTDEVNADSYGITRSESEDGSVVTLGSMTDNGLVRRRVAGAEENNTIKEVIFEEGIVTLYDRTCRRFYALEKVTLPNTLKTIGEAGTGVFQSCGELTEVNIPESVTKIGVGAFYGCRKLASINKVPSGVTRIEEDVFRESGIKTIEFHEGVTYFGPDAFRDCEDLETITIKAPVFTVESGTFLNAASPYPTVTIWVANAEMQAYLQSKVASYFTVKVIGEE